jgi:3-hydroxyacyl-[acyl-carrier-protein] dehydratase
MAQAAITVGGKPRCSAQLTFALSPFPNPEFRSHMEEMARRIEFPQHAMIQS